MFDGADVWAAYAAVRAQRPLVHNITNYVSMDIAANALLAAGASPVMAHAQEEVADLAAAAGALVINIGTLSDAWVQAMYDAVAAANDNGTPWVLDPVGVGATRYRTDVAAKLLEASPLVIRGNASEILALSGAAVGGRGVDSTADAADAVTAARDLAEQTGAVVAVTGAVDRVTDGHRVAAIDAGHPMMAAVTALGCAASGLVGAFCAVTEDPLLATAAALAVFGLAGELAAAQSPGPGTLRWRLLDELYALDEDDVRNGVRLS